MKFRCHVCGREIASNVMFLLSMQEKDVDRPFVACSKGCCERADSVYWVKVTIKHPLPL